MRRFLTFSDRVILRTLAINVLFVVVLLAAEFFRRPVLAPVFFRWGSN